MLPEARRREYLAALDIDVYTVRGGEAVTAGDVADEPVSEVAPDWQNLESRVSKCTGCDLHQTRTQTVFGVGNREADWMIVGE